MDHSHSHEGLAGGWSRWFSHPALRVLLVAIAAVGVATAVAVVALWPDGSGRGDVQEQARQLGLASERFGAAVESVTDGPCSYSTDEAPQQCRLIVVVPDEGPDTGLPVTLPEFNTATGARHS